MQDQREVSRQHLFLNFSSRSLLTICCLSGQWNRCSLTSSALHFHLFWTSVCLMHLQNRQILCKFRILDKRGQQSGFGWLLFSWNLQLMFSCGYPQQFSMKSKFRTVSSLSEISSASIDRKWEQNKKDCQAHLTRLYGEYSEKANKNFPWDTFLREMKYCTRIPANRDFYEKKLKSINLQLQFKTVTKKRFTALLKLSDFVQKNTQDPQLTSLFSAISSFKSCRRNVRKIVPELKAKEEQIYTDMLRTLQSCPNQTSKLKIVCKQLIDFYQQNYILHKSLAKISEMPVDHFESNCPGLQEQKASQFRFGDEMSIMMGCPYQFSLEEHMFDETPLVQRVEEKSDEAVQRKTDEAEQILRQLKKVESYMWLTKDEPDETD